MRVSFWMSSIAILTAVAAPGAALADAPDPDAHAGHHDHGGYGEKLGTVVLPARCAEAATGHLERGFALLHSMTYEGARDAFAAAAAADPECSLAPWGQAMSWIHPLWSDPPSEAAFAGGRELVARAKALARTERERAYAEAADAYYARGHSRNEKDHLAAFAAAWEAVHRADPEDPEAALIFALAHLATADPADKSYATQRRAGSIAKQVLERYPDHPGAHHYVIHAFDVPTLAGEALAVARSYGDLAPAVPHALHMPTHILTRLGLWAESIDWNRRSAESALRFPVEGAISMHYLHALDYLAYAHLQRGEDRQAQEVARTVAALEGPFQVEAATPYTLAAVPARLALERQRWAEAAALQPRTPASFPWEKFPALEAITWFARALGAARSGDPASARQAIARLAELRDEAQKTSAYWAKQVEIQRQSAAAWLEFESGRRAEGVELMRAAAELEATTEKHPVTPGEVLPARELLGEMLLETGAWAEAREAFEAVLERSPNRLNGLAGAGHAAEEMGDHEAAERHYRALVELTAGAEGGPARLARAREFLARPRIGG